MSSLDCSIIITIFIALIGWFVGYYFVNIQINKTKKKEVITKYLIEAYKNIEDACGREIRSDEQTRNLEKALSSIQLFGTLEEIQLAKNMATEMNKTSYTDPRELLILLRYDLRKELNLDQVPTNSDDIIHWRIKK